MEPSLSPPAPRPVCSAPVKGGSETIVVIEDDAAAHADPAGMLPTLGYRVLRAADAGAALELLQGTVPIDLLLAEFTPSAPELTTRARELAPGVAVLFTSATVHDGAADRFGRQAGVEILGRPYSLQDLARAVRHVLGNQQQVNALARALRESRRPLAAPRPLAVLLVEDQDAVRDTARQLLELFDCRVEAMSSAEAAEAALRRAAFDVLLTDISLPGRSGIELARRAAQLQPAIALVLSSGYGGAHVDAAGLEGLRTRRLPKPYGVAEVEALLRDLRRA